MDERGCCFRIPIRKRRQGCPWRVKKLIAEQRKKIAKKATKASRRYATPRQKPRGKQSKVKIARMVALNTYEYLSSRSIDCVEFGLWKGSSSTARVTQRVGRSKSVILCIEGRTRLSSFAELDWLLKPLFPERYMWQFVFIFGAFRFGVLLP